MNTPITPSAPAAPERHASPGSIRGAWRWFRRARFGLSTLLACVAGTWGQLAAVAAEMPATGIIEGAVLHATSGNFLNNARVAVRGTTVETMTNEVGAYRLTGVPAGEAQVAVTFIGMESQVVAIRVAAGETVRRDFTLALAGQPADDKIVKLDPYTVAERELSGQAIALQERRGAPNIKSVISLEEFGDMGEGNVGEVLKYVPGINIDYNPQTPQYASIRGMPSTGTLVLLNGAQMGSSADNTRSFELGLSANGNIDRVEITKVPTPELPANAVGGTINMIPKSGFSRSKPLFTYNLFLGTVGLHGIKDLDLSFDQKAGMDPKSDFRSLQPAFNLSYILPLNKSLAFTFSLSRAQRTQDWEFLYSQWDQVRGVQTLTRPGALVFGEERDLASIGVDWRVAKQHTMQVSFQGSTQSNLTRQAHLQVVAGAGATGDRYSTQGAATGVGSATQVFNTWTGQYKSLKHLTWNYRYDGAVWKFDANASWSRAALNRKHAEDGFFINISTSLPNLIVKWDGIDAISHGKNARISATTRTGQPVDIFDGNNYAVTAVQENPLKVKDDVYSAGFNLRHDLPFRLQTSIRVGALVTEQTKVSKGGSWSRGFAPPGGAAAQSARNYDLIATEYSARLPLVDAYSHPLNIKWLSPYKMHTLYTQHPEWFTFTAANAAAYHTSTVNTSKKLQETVSAAYVRGDLKLVDNRLWLVGGVRFERTDDEGRGPLNDIRAIYQQDANGNLLRSPTGALIPVTTDVYERAKLQLVERGARSKTNYDGLFPSFNSSYDITENIVLRAAYAKTIGRPNLSEIIPGVTVTDPSATPENRRITVINSKLKPWTANNYDVSLEAYNIKGAVANVSLFRKEISNFFGSVTSEATPALLEEFGLTDDYIDYQIVTKRNFGAATISGYEVGYRQSLLFLPDWLKGIQAYGNITGLDLSGPNAESFTNFSPRNISWGLSYVRPNFVGKINVAQTKRIRASPAAASATIPAGSYNVAGPQTRIDLSLEYRLLKSFSVYVSVRNLMAVPKRNGVLAPGAPDYTTYNYYQYTGAMFTFGVKGSF
jgi:TonB-dependent receptor